MSSQVAEDIDSNLKNDEEYCILKNKLGTYQDHSVYKCDTENASKLKNLINEKSDIEKELDILKESLKDNETKLAEVNKIRLNLMEDLKKKIQMMN